MIRPPIFALRALVQLALATAVFALLAVLLPATGDAQPPFEATSKPATNQLGALLPPPPPPDCATPWYGGRAVTSKQEDAAAGYGWVPNPQFFSIDEVINYDSAHPESIHQRSTITDAIYTDHFDADGFSARSVSSTFGMATKSFMHLADGQSPYGRPSYAELQFTQGVTVVGDDAVIRLDTALLETVFGQESVFAFDSTAIFFIEVAQGDGGEQIHVSSIFDHEFVTNWPGTGAPVRYIEVPVEPDDYRIGVIMETSIDAGAPGLAQATNVLDLFADWKVTCYQPDPAPVPEPVSVRGRRAPHQG